MSVKNFPFAPGFQPRLTQRSSNLDNVKSLESVIYDILSKKTKKDADWWKNKMRSDTFFTAEELLEIGVIDQII